ncbi:MAG: hypothetical protein KAH10_02990 [Flavobacteriales bacterium]|nr:hypothetical protein [Flavobacteriales bacterium]
MKHFFVLSLFFLHVTSFAQDNFRIIFYNVENLFDTHNNTMTKDDEFTENGSRHWNNYKYWQKIKKTSKTLKIIGGWEAPAIIGLSEIENDTVLQNLIYTDALKRYDFRIIHRDSPDRRGIDVALLYRKDKFFPLNSKFFPLLDHNNNIIRSREILYTKGIVKGGDTLHFMIVHFPSRYGGYKNSEPKRILAAKRIISICDSLNEKFYNPKLIIMGDFNDESSNTSLQNINNNSNLNLLDSDHGTHKFGGKWGKLDHFISSNSLMNNSSTYIKDNQCKVFYEDFLLTKDDKYLGKKTNRTYIGFKYNGGFSDHLPIYIDLIIK